MKRTALLLLAFLLAVLVPAQNRMNYSIASTESGHVALGLALRKLPVSATFLQAPAHPDDETNAVLAYFAHGMGFRSIDLQNNRGDGGQNEIGPELFRDMAVLRTSELLSAHRLDGAEQYFTRAIDYGYSFSPEEVIEKWGRREIVGDYVRLFRTLRPDVVLTMNIQGRGGDRAHEATTILVREAWHAAADPAQYPEQIREGLHAWQPRKLYFSGGGGPGGGRGPNGAGRGAAAATPGAAPAAAANAQPAARLARVNTAQYDTLLGRTYAEIGSDARASHKCQGVGGMAPLPGGGGRGGPGGGGGYSLQDTTIAGQRDRDEASLFDGVDTSLTGIAQYTGPYPPAPLVSSLNGILADARRAQAAFDSGKDAAVAAPVEAALVSLRALRAQLTSMVSDPAARYEVDFRLARKERDYEDAVIAAHGLTFEAIADDGLVVPGQAVRLNLVAANRGAADVAISAVSLSGFDASGSCPAGDLKKDAAYTCGPELHIPKDAKLTTPYFTDDYWKHPANPAINIYDPSVPFGVPFAPSPFRAAFRIKAGSVEVTREIPVQHRYVEDTFTGEKRMEVNVVPAFSVRFTAGLAVFPASGVNVREVRVAVTNGAKAAAQAVAALELPAGWQAEPASMPIAFTREDESLSVRFRITAPAQVKTGSYTLRAIVTPSGGADRFTSGYQEIEYPHVQRRQVIKPAEMALKVVDVKIIPGITVGYIAGAGDQVPAAIEELGAKLSFIDENELASGDLSKYEVIVTGVRAYERRNDLRAYNRRLLDYAEKGGTVLVQYNKMEFNQAEYGPYPAKVSGNRVSDESVPVKVLAPAHLAFNYPNKITEAAWSGWVQERGLYFLGEKDKRYSDLVAITDSFKDNPGEKLGSLVEATPGKGRWMYVGLALWRQLPAGTDGAYQLLANLLSLGKATPAR